MNFIKSDLSLTWQEIRKQHYDLHMLLGFGVGQIVGSLKAPWPITIVLSFLLAFVCGFFLEAYQAVFKQAETDERDYRFTSYGGIISIPVSLIFLVLGISGWWLFAMGTLIVAIACYLRNKR